MFKFNLRLVTILERELFIRYYLGKALEEQGTYVVRSPWMEGKDAEEDFGVSSR